MGKTVPPRPRRHKNFASETERRILKAAREERFKHQPEGFLEVWAHIFSQLQDDDGRDTTFHTTCVHQIMGTSKLMTEETETRARNAWRLAYGHEADPDFLTRSPDNEGNPQPNESIARPQNEIVQYP